MGLFYPTFVTSALYPTKKRGKQWYVRRMFFRAYSPQTLRLVKRLCSAVLVMIAVALVGAMRMSMTSLTPLVCGILAGGALLAVLLVWPAPDIGVADMNGAFDAIGGRREHGDGDPLDQAFADAWNENTDLDAGAFRTPRMGMNVTNQRKSMLLATRAGAGTTPFTRPTCATNTSQQLGDININVCDVIMTLKIASTQVTAGLMWLRSLVPAQSIARPPCMAALAIGVVYAEYTRAKLYLTLRCPAAIRGLR